MHRHICEVINVFIGSDSRLKDVKPFLRNVPQEEEKNVTQEVKNKNEFEENSRMMM